MHMHESHPSRVGGSHYAGSQLPLYPGAWSLVRGPEALVNNVGLASKPTMLLKGRAGMHDLRMLGWRPACLTVK